MTKIFHCLLVALAVSVVAVSGKYMGHTNQAALNIIKQYEGYHKGYYKDVEGRQKIGYGHNCVSCNEPLMGKYYSPISTVSRASSLLKEDLGSSGRYEDCIRKAVTYSSLTSNQFSALVSLLHSQGWVNCGTFRRSLLRQKLNGGNLTLAAEEFGKYVKVKGKPEPSLVRRRAAERTLFCSGGLC